MNKISNTRLPTERDLESLIEEYQACAAKLTNIDLSRRSVLNLSAATAGSLVLGFFAAGTPRVAHSARGDFQPNA